MNWLILALGYLIGAVPTAYIAGRLIRGVDIRQVGDGNAGAANVFHELGHRVGITVGIVDAAKGALAIVLAQLAGLSQIWVMFTGVAAVIGHNWPVYIGFRGGRGEATALGALLALIPQAIGIMSIIGLIVLLLKKNVILTSAVMFVPLSLVCWLLGVSLSLIIYSIALPCLVGFTHYLRTRSAVHPGNA